MRNFKAAIFLYLACLVCLGVPLAIILAGCELFDMHEQSPADRARYEVDPETGEVTVSFQPPEFSDKTKKAVKEGAEVGLTALETILYGGGGLGATAAGLLGLIKGRNKFKEKRQQKRQAQEKTFVAALAEGLREANKQTNNLLEGEEAPDPPEKRRRGKKT